MSKRIAIIGGGAAGFFCAAILAEHLPAKQITIFERSEKILQKVKISGGGRCNVTHRIMEPEQLAAKYPRGNKELLGPFHKFDSRHTISWFEKNGVILKTEADGRMFPVTDSSQTIVDCLVKATLDKGVVLKTLCGIKGLRMKNSLWELDAEDGVFVADAVLIATGSSPLFWETIIQSTQHSLVEPVPSLFTFNSKSTLLRDLSGVSVANAVVKISGTKWLAEGPLLITHWGLSGPAVLRLSAWAARWLHEKNYDFTIEINWKPNWNKNQAFEWLIGNRKSNPKKKLLNLVEHGIPARLWQNMVEYTLGKEDRPMADIPNISLEKLAETITCCILDIHGKSTFKDEFVTAGGIQLKEIDFKNFQSKLHPGLFFAGEVLNMDAITGGFNFQSAWTGAYLSAMGMLDIVS